MSQDIAFSGLVEIGKQIAKRKISSLEVTRAMLARIENLDPKLLSYVSVLNDYAEKSARRADREIARGKKRGPLHGVPMTIKDALCTEGLVTVGGIPECKDNVPASNAVAAPMPDVAPVTSTAFPSSCVMNPSLCGYLDD